MSLQLDTTKYSDLSDNKNEKVNKNDKLFVFVMAIAGHKVLLSISQVPEIHTVATARFAEGTTYNK